MQFRMTEGLEVLQQTPAVLDALLRGKSQTWLNTRNTADAFSPVDVLGHLIHGERTDWIPRTRIMLVHQDRQAFEPFDRFGFQDLIAGKTIDALLEDFAQARHQSLAALHSFKLTEAQFALPGLHPELGPVTLGNHLANWVVHDLGHITQIAKTMAWAYRDETGPWFAYTTILH